jgi:hypothetical protein
MLGGYMAMQNFLIGAIALGGYAVTGFASPSPDAMRAASAVQINTKYSSSVSLTRDPDGNIVSFHANGVSPTDAGILLTKDSSPLSTEFTIISGTTKEGGISTYMLPSNVATARVIESISQDLVNYGAISVQITKQISGRS